MPISPIFALGLLTQSVFVGGHVATSSVFIPDILESEASPQTQLRLWEGLFDRVQPIMSKCAFVSFACYMYEAYNAGAGSPLRQAALVSGGLSVSAVVFSVLVIFRLVGKLKSMKTMDDETLIAKNYSNMIANWSKLSMVRMTIFTAGFINALCYLVKY